MSAFLGPIHNWLYNKIKFQEELIQYIQQLIISKDYGNSLLSQMDQRYGVLEKGEPADIIDESDIHGWLQERITIVENRLAFLITMTTEEHPERIMDIHAPYWDMIHGNPEYYYAIRESLIIGMLENSGITYQQTGDQSFGAVAAKFRSI